MKQEIKIEVYDKKLGEITLEGFLIDTIEINKMYHNGITLKYTGNVMDENHNVYMTFIDTENSDNWFVEIKY